MITQERLRELFYYEDGNLYWKEVTGRRKPGPIGCLNKSTGYICHSVDGKYCMLHRLIFMHQYGVLPEFVDHIDGDRTNNRVENLRSATRTQNAFNRKRPAHNKSGVKGVHWCKIAKRWIVQIKIDYENIRVGAFTSLEEAKRAIEKAREELHGRYARHA